MERNFAAALEHVLKHEGGYVNHPKDPGGATNMGITIHTARRLGIDVDGDGDTDIVDIKKLTKKDAAKVYRSEYWNKVKGDSLPNGVDYAVFDFAVNSGVSRASKFLQHVVGAKPDGRIGQKTLAAVANHDPKFVITQLCNDRLEWLRRLKTFKTFGKGWTRRVNGVLAQAKAMAIDAPTPPKRPASQSIISMLIDLVLKLVGMKK
jgi:lysozyme family protein